MKLQVIVGAQYGSEAKGAVAGFLARHLDAPLCVRVGGPNAGHTVYDDDGREWKLQQVPVGLVTNPLAEGYIAPGSEVDVDILNREISDLNRAGFQVSGRLTVSAEATVIEPRHTLVELGGEGKNHGEDGLTLQVGSTGKGVGAARADRAMRRALRVADVDPGPLLCPVVEGDLPVRQAEVAGRDVQIEGTQGYALGSHAGLYPYCTSRDCRAVDFISESGVNDPWLYDPEVWVVARVFPIRVAGNSGPLKGETTWSALGLAEERTTVTKKVRRVGEWDIDLVRRAVAANGGPDRVRLAITMVDQLVPGVADHPIHFEAIGWGPDNHEAVRWLTDVAHLVGCPVALVGTGPQSHHFAQP